MIIFFGPAGAGKSVQGQILAARHDWRWLSTGQLLRDTHDVELVKIMHDGKLVPYEKVNEVIDTALNRAKDIKKVILDGYPRQLEQAHWLVENVPKFGRSIDLIIILEVPSSELMKRLNLRGRADDTTDSINERLNIYRQEIYPILDYFSKQGIKTVHIDGTGTVGQVHDRIMEELSSCNLA